MSCRFAPLLHFYFSMRLSSLFLTHKHLNNHGNR